MRLRVCSPYNEYVPTTSPAEAPSAEPAFAAAGLFLEQLAARDFAGLKVALEPDATLKALLPRGFCEWEGREEVCDAFAGMLGGTEEYAVLEATVGLVGTRLQLAWRLRVSGGKVGPHNHVVEQQSYADPGPTGRIRSISLVCSGFCREQPAHSTKESS